MEQAIEKQEEQKPTRRKKEKKGMPMLLQLILDTVDAVKLALGQGGNNGLMEEEKL